MTLVTPGEWNEEEAAVTLMRRVLFLRMLPEEALRGLLHTGLVRPLGRGEVLFLENQPGGPLMVVLAGAVRVFKTDHRGRELTLGREGPGSTLAEAPLFDGGNYPASAEGAEDGTAVLVVPRAAFQRLMQAHSEVASAALRLMSIRLRRMLYMLEAQSLHPVRARLARYLLDAANGQSRFLLTEGNEAIAGQVGTVREVVSRTLKALREAGVIAVSGRLVSVLRPEDLARLASGRDDP